MQAKNKMNTEKKTYTCWTAWQVLLWYGCHSLELFMAWIAEVSGAEAEKDGHRAAVATLVLEEVSSMLCTHLSPRHIRATTTDKLRWIKVIPTSYSFITSRFTTIVSLENNVKIIYHSFLDST